MDNTIIGDVMVSFPHTVGLKITLQRAKEVMQELNVRHLPVQHGGKLIGVVTDRDIHFALAIDKKDAAELSVEDAYTSDPYIVDPEATLVEVVSKMAKDALGCTLVAKGSELVGIFTTVDVCRVFAKRLAS